MLVAASDIVAYTFYQIHLVSVKTQLDFCSVSLEILLQSV
jgi:hypothetical protein